MLALVYDRTAGDVSEAAALIATGRAIARRLKGCYDHIDRNRVGLATAELASWLNDHGYVNGVVGAADWQPSTHPDAQRNAAMLAAVRALADCFALSSAAPPLPESLDAMDYNDANALEAVLASLQRSAEWHSRAQWRHFGAYTWGG